jgi:cytochrome P450
MVDVKDSPLLTGAIDVTDYREITEILRSSSFASVAFPLGHATMVPGSLGALDGEEHAARRRLTAKLFGGLAVASYVERALKPTIESALADLFGPGRLDPSADQVVRADLVPLTWRLAHSIPALLVGLDGVEGAEASERFIRYLQAIALAVTVDWQRGDHDRILAEGKRAQALLETDFFDASVARRREMVARLRSGGLTEDDLPRDLITLLLLHWKPEWEPELLIRETMFFLVASVTTTAKSFPHFIVNLSRWLDAHPDMRDEARSLPFLQRAANESLRFFVASPARLREAREDVVLTTSERRVAAGERVALWFLPANAQQDEFGEDAAEFNPLREVSGRAPYGLAFGAGVHMCIGKPLITGVTLRDDEGNAVPVDGTMAHMAAALFDAGLALDDTRAPRMNDRTYYSEYASLPVVFTSPAAHHSQRTKELR